MIFAFCGEKKARINEIRPSEQFWISSNKVGTIHYLYPTLFRQATINDKVTVKLTSQISINIDLILKIGVLWAHSLEYH